MDTNEVSRSELDVHPTLLGAAWRYRWLILGWISLGALIGAAYDLTRPTLYQATAAILVQDPRTTGIVASGATLRAERYVLDQLEVLRSSVVAVAAADLLDQQYPDGDLGPGEVVSSLRVDGTPSSDLIRITFEADIPELAMVGAESVALAYQDVVSEQISGNAQAAFDEIDRAIVAVDNNLAQLNDQLEATRSGGVARAELETQLGTAIEEIARLQRELKETSDPDRAEGIRARLRDLRDQMSTLQILRQVDAEDPRMAALRQERAALLQRRGDLAASRSELQIESQMQSSGVALYSPPVDARESTGPGLARLLLAGIGVGGAVGLSLSYLFAGRNRVFGNRAEPGLLLRAPLLADVPDFQVEELPTTLPARDAPRSASAEAYRFAAAAIQIREPNARSLAIIGSLNGSGKTVTTANLGISMARKGNRVLLIDADFGNQALTQLLLGGSGIVAEDHISIPLGLTEVVEENYPLEGALQRIRLRPDLEITLLARGRVPVVAIDFFSSLQTRQVVQKAAAEFDFVLVDTPPFLQVAYASAVAGYTDGVAVVVDHESRVRELDELIGRLAFLDVPVVGYVYNLAPFRREMALVEGSMQDVLGDQGWTG